MASQTSDSLIEELKRDAEKGELLLWAAARGLSADVTDLVQNGADPGAKDKRGRQAVHYAASNGHVDILEFLFTKGVLLDAEDDVGRGALHYAAAGGHTGCVSFLLGKECWRDAPDAEDDTPLHLAARAGAVEALKVLVEAGAKLSLPNKRSLTPFAEAVLAGQTAAAEYLGGVMPGGLPVALAATYRGVPLLHLAAGLGQAAAVEWLIRQQRCDPAAPATDRGYTPLHAAALSGDEATVTALIKLGADPLAETADGKLPLELVPKAAPARAPPPPPPGSLPPPEEAPGQGPSPPDRELVRLARRAFRALARAAAERGGVDLGRDVVAAGPGAGKGGGAGPAQSGGGRAGRAAVGAKAVQAAGRQAGRSGGKAARGARGEAGEKEEEEEQGGGEMESPAAIFLRQVLAMTTEQRVAKVESYARMDERQVAELPYLDTEAQAAITSLRQAMGMVELFGAIAALRADEDFQSDIRDPRVREALAEVKRTNNLERYEDQPAVMSVANKFKRLHGISRKAGGLQVVIDDLRAELPGNDAATTRQKAEEMRAAQQACAVRAAEVVLASATAAVPESVRARIAQQLDKQAARGPAAVGSGQRGGAQVAEVSGGGSKKALDVQGSVAKDEGEGPDEQLPGEDGATFKARMAKKARIDRLRAAATSAWTGRSKVEEDIGFVDRFEKEYEKRAKKGDGKRRWRLADHVGEELAQSLWHTLKALLLTLAAFAVMWIFGLMPHQQTAALQARLEAARRAQEAAERVAAAAAAGLDGIEGGQDAATAAAAVVAAAEEQLLEGGVP